jgi:kinetochore protein Spc25, fungi type
MILFVEEKRHRNLDIESAHHKAQTLTKTVAKDAEEAADARNEIETVTARRDELLERKEALSSELGSLQNTLAARRDAQAKHAKYLHSQARWNGPELQFWEDYLCMRIDGAGMEDRLKFVFTHVCEKEWEREAWFELDTSDREYRVLKTWPKVEREEVEGCLEKLNEGRELGPFFKSMREIFVKAYK